MSIKVKNVFTCFHPKRIRNKNGDIITVGCGHCPACLNRRASRNSMLCTLEETDHKFAIFVTLTYNNTFIPLMRPVKRYINGTNEYTYDFFDETERFRKYKHYNSYLFSHALEDSSLALFQRKVANKTSHYGECLPYLAARDACNFLKKFREYLKLYSDEKIRYYVVGEYGPDHLRPHFHFIFYFSDVKIFQNYRKALLLSWAKRIRYYNKERKKFCYKTVSFGRVDSSLSRHKCSSYVAGYVNSFATLPRLYKNHAVCPFSHHSNRFGQKFYQDKKKEIYENAPSYFVFQSREVFGKPLQLHPWRSLISLFYPKVRRFCDFDSDSLLYAYTILRKARCFYTFASLMDLSKQVFSDLYGILSSCSYYIFIQSKPKLCQKNFFLRFIAQMTDLHEIEDVCNMDADEIERLILRIYQIFLTSRHFLTFVCDYQSYREYRYKVRLIVDFYKYFDYQNLLEFYKSQDKLLFDDGERLLPYFYDNSCIDLDDLDALRTLKSYTNFVLSEEQRFDKNIKHKKENDANEILLNL